MRLKKLRKEAGLKQEEMAQILKITTKSYQNYELELRKMPLKKLIELANYHNVTLDYLVGREFVGGQQINEEEYQLIEIFRKLKREEQTRLLGYAMYQVSTQENLKEDTEQRSSYGK